jgi:microsomal dipeptidase-like Zn-dependent dipeptidase
MDNRLLPTNEKAVAVLNDITVDCMQQFPQMTFDDVVKLVKHIVACINDHHIVITKDTDMVDITIDEVPDFMTDDEIQELVERVANFMLDVASEVKH